MVPEMKNILESFHEPDAGSYLCLQMLEL